MESTRVARLLCCLALFLSVASSLSQAQKLTTLHSFDTTDGSQPFAAPVQGSDGNFYGTTAGGGSFQIGTFFRITPSGALTSLYSFYIDGAAPYGKLVLASDGNYYGTLYAGGNIACQYGCGALFKISPAGDYTRIYAFGGGDGATPRGGLVQAKDGNLYGTTLAGGKNNSGTLFKISLDGTFASLYSFCSQNNCSDGSAPHAELVQGRDGNLYGTAGNGGSMNCTSGCGTVFKISPSGMLTTLHTFNDEDGSYPYAALVQGSDGNFYGTTFAGGEKEQGTVFKITPQGALTTLHSFCLDSGCTDGAAPYAALIQGSDGTFYGTTQVGGAHNQGTIFSISPTGVHTSLYSFGGSDGANPSSALAEGRDGKLYGTTQLGGTDGHGTVFSFSTALQFVPVTPCRVVDTRNPNGTFGGPFIAANSSRDFPIPRGSCNIPSTASAYSLNATVVPHGSLGYVTVWPTGFPRPLVSTMNSYDGRVKADAVIMPNGDNGGVSVYASDATDVVLDINGYFEAPAKSTLAFYPVAPCRTVDTRNPNGPLGGPYIKGKNSREFPILFSNCRLPDGVLAYSMNFTAVPHGQLGFLTVWPSDQQQPYVSTLNAYSGAATANGAIVPAAKNGDISAYVSDDSDLVIDVNGYFAPPGMGGLSLYPLVPCRVLDTRNGSGVFSGELTVNVKGSGCFVPTSAQAYIFNATVVPPGPLGFLTLWADSQQQPPVSTLNAYDGAVTSNMAIVPTVNGLIDAFASDPTNLLLDISSYFAP